jgi:hypothetical protein
VPVTKLKESLDELISAMPGPTEDHGKPARNGRRTITLPADSVTLASMLRALRELCGRLPCADDDAYSGSWALAEACCQAESLEPKARGLDGLAGWEMYSPVRWNNETSKKAGNHRDRRGRRAG